MDLILCAILYYIAFSKGSNMRIVEDKITGKPYIIQEKIKYAGRRATVVLNDDEERDADEEREKVNAAFLSEFEDLGWEGRIVS